MMMMLPSNKPFEQIQTDAHHSVPDAINVTPENPLLEVLKFVGGFTALIVGLYFLVLWAIGGLIPLIPPQQERIFEPIALEYLRGKKTSPMAEDALKPDFELLLQNVPSIYRHELPLKLHVLDEPILNAFAIPGGHIVTYTGLTNTFTARDERLFVLAHEIGHFAKRHHLKKLSEGLAVYLLLTPVNVFTPEIGKAFGHFVQLDSIAHSQAQELEADLFALETMQSMGLDAMAAVRVFKQFRALNPDEEKRKWQLDHPTSLDRIKQVRAYLVAHPTAEKLFKQ
jgi:Zn-dependent protease with chaperone function